MKAENMGQEEVKGLIERFADAKAEELVQFFLEKFTGKAGIASSLGAEDQVLTHMALQGDKGAYIFTLDTGRLPQETYDLMQETMDKYGMKYSVCFPERAAVEAMENGYGPNLFYASIENRKKCCNVRKMEPLKRAFTGLNAWITGLRKEQAVTRGGTDKIEWDAANGLIKVNPLADWTTEQVWDYIKKNNVPYNRLHDKGFPSIGCAPCTRAVKPGEDIRAGRWWWETPEQKECGLHVKGGKLVRSNDGGKDGQT